MTDMPPRSLNILTLDGGVLDASTTLLILSRLLETIAEKHGMKEIPRPCDVFDTIAGYGTGGWLAMLLGRFRMTITDCLTEWHKLLKCLEPRFKFETLRLLLLHHCWVDHARLVGEVDTLTKLYGTGDYLFEPGINGVRTRHVIVTAMNSKSSDDETKYHLFRSYAIPESAKLPQKLHLQGPKDPSEFKISSAFGVTGAAKHFTRPWKEQMADGREISFQDTQFPKRHNITVLALEEMWGIYGIDVPLSIVLNIGPGRPYATDVLISRGFFWGSNKDRGVDVELAELDHDIEKTILKKLDDVRPGDNAPYFRLPLPEKPFSKNGFSNLLEAVTDYFRQSLVSTGIEEMAARVRLQEVDSAC